MGKRGSRFRLSQLIIYLFCDTTVLLATTIRKLFILLVVVGCGKCGLITLCHDCLEPAG